MVEVHEQVAGLLGNPGTGRVSGGADNLDSAGRQFQEEQDVDPFEEHRVDGEEVAGEDAVGLGGEELFPCRPAASWCRVDAGVVQDLSHCAGRDLVAEADEFTLHAAVSPGRVLGRQVQNEPADLAGDRWPPGTPMWVGPVPGQELPMPAQQRGRGDEERRPPGAGEQSGQRRQQHPVRGPKIRAVDLTTQHRHLMAQYQQFDVLGATVAGELGQHLQDLP
jgi:hypothetical protein